MADDTTKLRRGERNRVWAKPGPNDPPDGYLMRFVSYSLTTEWTETAAGTYPAGGGPGVYVWAANDVAGGPAGTVYLPRGDYRVQLRHGDGDLLDVEELPDLLQVLQ